MKVKEAWLRDLMGRSKELHQGLTDRELVIVVVGGLEAGLGELLIANLGGPEKLRTEFVDRANFDARAKLALLTGNIDDRAYAVLRALQVIRNKMAHLVLVTLESLSQPRGPLEDLLKAVASYTPESSRKDWERWQGQLLKTPGNRRWLLSLANLHMERVFAGKLIT